MHQTHRCFIPFTDDISEISAPQKFTFPFDYIPHPLAKLATTQLQTHLETQTNWVHNFGLDPTNSQDALGKMFGVLVVQSSQGELGYLAAFSGILANQTVLPNFVPSVYDRKKKSSFYVGLENELNQINAAVVSIENTPKYQSVLKHHHTNTEEANSSLITEKANQKAAKKNRDIIRKTIYPTLSETEQKELLQKLQKESMDIDFGYKRLAKQWKQKLAQSEAELAVFEKELITLKTKRKALSATLQQQLFNEYQLRNVANTKKGVLDIFKEISEKQPPAGTGDCAAPKLLQYAFIHGLKPVAMAEFWWGISPSLEVRKHGSYYPSCQSRCKPILGWMLQGLEVDENPITTIETEKLKIEIIFEDDDLLVISKPPELLSVPGKKIKDSVETRMKAQYPNATGPMLAHRLDMSTSGLMVISKSLEIHRELQNQFTKRTVKKRYEAILDGVVEQDSGIVELPLRVDIDNRPSQVVDFEHGKKAITHWEVISRSATQTHIYFFPITGRTHQLRVHASHPKGLNVSILGDDIYGTRKNRMYLHAGLLEFQHPVTKRVMKFELDSGFSL